MNTRKIYYLFTVLTLLLAFTGCDEDDPIDNIQTFEKSIAIGTSSQLTDIIINDDNSYLTVGTAEINGAEALLLMKVSPTGDTLWTRKYQNQKGYSIIKTQDGNYAISGVSKVTSSDSYGRTIVTKVDGQGNTIWSTELSQSTELFSLTDNVDLSSGNGNIEEAANGNLLVFTNPSRIKQTHFILDIIDSNGVKKHSIELPGFKAKDIKATIDGAFVIVGPIALSSPWIFLTKVQANGNVLWSKKIYGYDSHNDIRSIVQTTDGGFTMVGSSSNLKTYPYVLLLKTDQHGERTFITGFKMAFLSSGNMIDIKKNNGFLVAAYGYEYDSFKYDVKRDEPELIAFSVSSSGKLQYSKNFGKVGFLFFIKETKDGGIILGGNKDGHIFLTKTKPNFEL